LKPPVTDYVEAEPESAEAHVIDSETQESQFLEPRFGELQFAEPQFNDADFAEAQLVESLIVEPQFSERSRGDAGETVRAVAQPDTDDSPIWDLGAPETSHEPTANSHEAAEIGAFRSWFDREDPDVDSRDLARSQSIDAAIDAAIRSVNESIREPSRPVDRPIYGPPEPPIDPMIEAVIDRASRAQRAAQIERLEIWLQRLEELRRDISGQHDA
jgi:hypothetical protein